MSEPLTDEELELIAQKGNWYHGIHLPRLVAEIRFLRAENEEIRREYLERYLRTVEHVRSLMDALASERIVL